MAKKKSWLKRTWDKLVSAYKSAPRAYDSRVSNKANKAKQAEHKAEVKKKQEKKKREKEAKPASSQPPKYNRLTLNNWNQRDDRSGQADKPETDRKESGKKQEKNAFQKMIEDSKNGAKGTTPAAAYQQRLAKQREELKKLREDQARKKAGSSSDDKPKMTAPYSNEQLKKMEDEKKRAEQEKKDRLQNSHSLTGMKRMTEKEGISAKKAVEEAKKERKKKKESAPKQMTTDEALRMQWASSNPTYKTKKGGDKLIDEDLQKKIKHNAQSALDRGDVGVGFMSGSMPVADLKKSMEKKYGIKLDDSKAKEHLGYNIAEMAGYLAKSTAFGGAAEESISKALTNVILKKTGKKALGKAGKFAVNRGAEALAAAPVNLEDAAKNSENAKEFAQNVAANMALDAGFGSAVDGAKIANRFRKTAKAKTIRSAIHKTAKGQKLTEEEAKAFEGVKKRALKKEKGGKALNVQERLVNKAAAKSQAPAPTKQAERVVRKPDKKLAKPETRTVKSAQPKEETMRQMSALEKAQDIAYKKGITMREAASEAAREADGKFETEVEKLADFVYRYKGKGSEAHLVPTDKIDAVGGGEPFRALQRASNNDPVYREALKAYGKKPSKAESKEFAASKILEDIERYQRTGETHYVEPEVAKEILSADDMSRAVDIYKDGELRDIRTSDHGTEFTYQGKNPNVRQGKAKKLTAEKSSEVENAHRYQASSQASPDDSHLSADGLSKEAPKTVQVPDDPHLTSKTVSQDASLDKSIPNSSEKSKADTDKSVSRRLTPEDDAEYLATKADNKGKRKTIRAHKEGRKVVLHGDAEIKEYIGKAIKGEVDSPNMVAYGKANEKLSSAINEANPNVDVKDSYLEFVPNDLEHSYNEHATAKMPGDIDLSKEHYLKIPEYVDTFDDLLQVKTYAKSNATKVILGKKINGYAVIIEMVSKGRNSINFKNMWGMETEAYMKTFGIKKEKTMSVTSGSKGSNTSLSAAKSSFTDTSVPNPSKKVNTNEKISDETLFKHAKQMRKNGFTDSDIEKQFHKMGVDSQKAADIVGRKTVSGPADGKPRATKEEEIKSHNPKEYYKSAVGGITDEEVSQHYAKLSAQIMEDVNGNESVFKTLEFGEKQGLFGKARGISQEEALEKAGKEAEANLDECYRRFMEMDGFTDDSHLFEARAKVIYDKLVEDINQNGAKNVETIKKYMNLFEKATETASWFGRGMNAVKMLLRATPQGRLRIIDKEIKRLNERFADRLDGKTLELSEEQITRIAKAQTDEEIEKVMNAINVEIWDEIPATKFEKINEARHCFMLFNIKTHLRNLTGNEAFRQARHMSDCVEIGLNKLFKNRIESKGGSVDMVRVPRKDIRANKEYLDEVFEKAYEESGSVSRYIESYRPDGSSVIRSGALNKVVQANYKLLEKEDRIVFRPEYRKNYLRWCKSHGVDMSDLSKMTKKQKAAASEFAMRQAEIATFRDASALSNFITGKKTLLAGKKGKTALGTAAYRTGNMLLESQLPFVKTPINVFRRAVDYSPLGLIRGTAELMLAKNAEVLKQGIHHMATGMTGTALCAFGAYLNSKGIIELKAGNVSGDEYYDRDMGHQDYSIVFPAFGKEYSATIDWAAPMNVSLFMGAQIEETLQEKDGLTLTGVLKGLESISGPMLDMSFMSTAKDTISMFQEQAFRKSEGEDVDYDGAMIQTLFGSLPQGYLSSFVPQLVSQGAQAFDSKQRDTRSTKEDPLAKSWESWGRKMVNKVPGLRNHFLNPKLDRFGNDKETGNNVLLRFANAFVNPSNLKEIRFTDLDREIIKIYDHLPEETSKEKEAKKYFFYNFTGNPSYDLEDGKRMSYGEAYKYGKSKRKEQTGVIERMTKAKSYENMTWSMKSEEVSDAHWISQAVADKEIYGSEFAAKRIAKADWEKETLDAYKRLGGTDEKYVDFYIDSKKFYARAHNNDKYDYYTKALAVVKYGDKKLAKVYDINTDKIENAKEYLKKGGSVREYGNAMCNVMSGIDKAGVSSSIKNMAISAADFKINKRTRKAMGLDKDKSNMGIGLKKYGYTYESLDKMRMDCKYEFDADENGSLNKSEVVDYVNSLGLKEDAEKACVFEYLYGYSGANPWGIPNYLDMDDDESKGGSGGRRRYGRGRRGYGHRRSGGGSGGGSAATEKSAFEKYVDSLRNRQGGVDFEEAKTNGKTLAKSPTTKFKSKKLDISDFQSDAYRKAVIKLLAKRKLKDG